MFQRFLKKYRNRRAVAKISNVYGYLVDYADLSDYAALDVLIEALADLDREYFSI